jgi:hypothetical protein
VPDAPSPGDEDWEHWRLVARPIGLGPVLRVDTSCPVDVEPVVEWMTRGDAGGV